MSKYSENIVQKICDLIQDDTYTMKEICTQVGISETTLHRWKDEKSGFRESIKKAEELQLKNLTRIARRSMKRKLEGYDYNETKTINKSVKVGVKTTANKDGSVIKEDIYKPMKMEETTITKHVTPSDTMIIFYMKNQDKDNFGEEKEEKEIPKELNLNFSFGEQNDE